MLFVLSGLEARTFVLSLPKAGSNYLLNSLVFCLQRPYDHIYSLEQKLDQIVPKPELQFQNALQEPWVSKVPFAFKTHDLRVLNGFREDQDKLILIIRNPKEQLMRLKLYHHETPSDSFEKIFNLRSIENYLNFLHVFDEWNEKNRLLIFYEDMISDISDISLVLEKGVRFLGGKEKEKKRIEKFLRELKKNQKKILKAYNEYHHSLNSNSYSRSDIKSAIWYSKRLSKPQLLEVDQMLLNNNPVLTKRYLSRYLEEETYQAK